MLTLGSFLWADKYDDLLNDWFNRYGDDDIHTYGPAYDNMDLAWKWAPMIKARCYAYELLQQKILMDKAYQSINIIMNNAIKKNPMGQDAFLCNESRWKNPDATWWNDGVECTGESMLTLGAILRWIYVVKKYPALHNDYLAIANQWLEKIENDFFINKWIPWIVDDDRQEPCDYRYPGAMVLPQLACTTCTVDPYAEDYRLASSPHNKNSDFGLTMLTLYDITGKQEYFDIIRGVALNFKSKMIWQNGGEYYSWHYYDPTWVGDFSGGILGFNAKSGIWIEHRNGYGNISLKFATECYRRGIVFCRTDIERYIKTNRDIMWDGVTTRTSDCGVDPAQKTWKLNDGSGPPTVTSNCGGLYNALCPYDSTLEYLGYNSYASSPTSWGAKIDIPRFVYTMKIPPEKLYPPDTMHWVGPLEVINLEVIDRGAIRLTFYNEVDSASASQPSNYYFSRGIEALYVEIDPQDKRIVTVYTEEQDSQVNMKLRIRDVKDIYGNVTFAYQETNQPYPVSYTHLTLPTN